MATEIERKFLVSGDAWRAAGEPQRVTQGYLNRDKQRTVRVRVAGAHGYLTIKGMNRGASRPEFEYEIPPADAEALLKLADGPPVDKLRHRVPYAGMTWEVDEFLGDNYGLIVAEIELTREDQPFARPPWLGREVTGDARYYNSSLATCPYTRWPAA